MSMDTSTSPVQKRCLPDAAATHFVATWHRGILPVNSMCLWALGVPGRVMWDVQAPSALGKHFVQLTSARCQQAPWHQCFTPAPIQNNALPVHLSAWWLPQAASQCGMRPISCFSGRNVAKTILGKSCQALVNRLVSEPLHARPSPSTGFKISGRPR
mmetsp:Transcript_105846/g.188260  ORF Transcript_105846/g.188260 Transcript_105846/m.188260 type:complete len:157 (+) Transcript_105846:1844-2314(+)